MKKNLLIIVAAGLATASPVLAVAPDVSALSGVGADMASMAGTVLGYVLPAVLAFIGISLALRKVRAWLK